MIEGILRLADSPVRLIMTPRPDIIWIDNESDSNTILDTVESNRFSRFLLCNGTLDQPIGVVNTKDLLPKAIRYAEIKLTDIIAPLLYVPDSTTLLALLNQFKRE